MSEMKKLVVSEAVQLEPYSGTSKASGKPYTIFKIQCNGTIDGQEKSFLVQTMDKESVAQIKAGWSGEAEMKVRTVGDNTYTHYELPRAQGKGGFGNRPFVPKISWTPKEFDELWAHGIKAVNRTCDSIPLPAEGARAGAFSSLMQTYMSCAIAGGVKMSAPASAMNGPMKDNIIGTIKAVLKKYKLDEMVTYNGIKDEDLIKWWAASGGGEVAFSSKVKAEMQSVNPDSEPSGDQDDLPFSNE